MKGEQVVAQSILCNVVFIYRSETCRVSDAGKYTGAYGTTTWRNIANCSRQRDNSIGYARRKQLGESAKFVGLLSKVCKKDGERVSGKTIL